jgi:atypical dual specificity phosphatase
VIERYGLRVADRMHTGQERFAARGRRLAQARVALRMLFRLTDRGVWVAPGVLGCAYPRTERALATLSASGVRLLVNLHERPHDPARLGRHGLREVHLPVRDFAAPSSGQIERGVDAILGALAAGEAAAVHCGGGLGRTGTLLACYLASSEGLVAGEAIRRVRAIRTGSVETPAQAAAVDAWARHPGPTRA